MLGAWHTPLVPEVLEMVPTGRNLMGQQEAEEAFVGFFFDCCRNTEVSRGKKWN